MKINVRILIVILSCVLALSILITCLVMFSGLKGIYVSSENSNNFVVFRAGRRFEVHPTTEIRIRRKYKFSKNKITFIFTDPSSGEQSFHEMEFKKLDGNKKIKFGEFEYERAGFFKSKKVKINWNLQGGTGEVPKNQKQKILTKIDLPKEDPKKDGYVFMGWFDSPDWENEDTKKYGEGNYYENIINTVWKDITLYAGWGDILEIKDNVLISVRDKAVKNLIVPDGVTAVNEYAFYGCSELVKISLPESVTDIGNINFSGCSSLTNIDVDVENKYYSSKDGILYDRNKTSIIHVPQLIKGNIILPDTLEYIGNYDFYNRSLLEEITISYGVTNIGERAFDGCNSLRKFEVDSRNKYYSSDDGVLFDKNITKLYYYPVMETRTSYIIPESVKTIQFGAFKNCNFLESISLPSIIPRIGYLFGVENSEIPLSLKSVAITSGTYIPQGAFSGCQKLINITISDSVIALHNYAFQECTSLVSFVIPDSVRSLGGGVFENCSSLISVKIGSSIKEIENHTFRGCISLASITIPFGITRIGSGAFYSCRSLDSVVLPDSVTSIDSYAFSNCILLDSFVIPDGIKEIEYSTFSKCANLTSITIPDSVTKIGMNAFDGCQKLSSIIIPNSVTIIERDAFSNCANLTSITIPDSVIEIGEHVFYSCISLISIIIPNSIKTIGNYAFRNCTSLEKIYIERSSTQGITNIGTSVFLNCPKLLDIYVFDAASAMAYKVADGWSIYSDLIKINP